MVIKSSVLAGVAVSLLVGALVIAAAISKNCRWKEAELSSATQSSSIERDESESFKERLLLSAAEFGDVMRVKDLLEDFQHGMFQPCLGYGLGCHEGNA